MKIRIEERTRNRQIIHVPRSTFTFYLQTTIQPLYFMRYAQFYALAIFFMYAVELARKAIPLVETQSSSWSVSLYMIFSFRIIWRWQGNMRQDKDIDYLPGC